MDTVKHRERLCLLNGSSQFRQKWLKWITQKKMMNDMLTSDLLYLENITEGH